MPAAPTALSAAAVAQLVGGRVRGDAEVELSGVATLERAGPRDLSFLHRADYREQAARSRAACILVGDEAALPGRTVIVVADPRRALAAAVRAFHPAPRRVPGRSPDASVDPSAEIAPSAHVGPFAVVGAGAAIGDGSAILAGAVVGEGCVVGRDCTVHPRAVLYPGTRLGDRVIVHAGAVLGADGFGYASGAGGHEKIPHVGVVVVEDDVEVGANACIDRAGLAETRIGRGTKIDNLVQVAHDVAVGPGCLLVAQSGIAGSTTLGEGCVLAGQSGVGGHLEVGDGVRVGAKSAVLADVPAGRTVSGIPAMPHARWRRVVAALPRLPDLVRAVRPRGATDDGETP